jgi:putative mycofactocin binding protein MftB
MECAVSTDSSATARPFDLDTGWRLDPRTSIRPESFGALLYHFGTRRLTFLKSPTLLTVVQALAGAPTARAACVEAGVPVEDLPRYRMALGALAESGMIETRAAG